MSRHSARDATASAIVGQQLDGALEILQRRLDLARTHAMATAAEQGLALPLGVGIVDAGEVRMARALLPKAAGARQRGFQKTWLAQ